MVTLKPEVILNKDGEKYKLKKIVVYRQNHEEDNISIDGFEIKYKAFKQMDLYHNIYDLVEISVKPEKGKEPIGSLDEIIDKTDSLINEIENYKPKKFQIENYREEEIKAEKLLKEKGHDASVTIY